MNIPIEGSVPRPAVRGFTLIELMVVIAIATLIMAMSVPALSSLQSGGSVNRTLGELSGLLEQARQYAVAQNTYVWVAFFATNNTQGVPQLNVAVVASTDGTDPFSAFNPQGTLGAASIPSTSGIALVDKIASFREVLLADAGTFPLPSLKNAYVSAPTSANNPYDQGSLFSIRLPGSATPASFTRTIEFRPDGQARNGQSLTGAIELDFQPAVSTASSKTNNAAVIQVNGLTGENTVYRQ